MGHEGWYDEHSPYFWVFAGAAGWERDGEGTVAAWGSLVAWGDGRDRSIPLTNLEEPGKSKIGDFASEFLSHQDVSGCQVPVDNVLLLQVPHPIRHLAGDVEQVGGAQGLPFRTC